MNSKYELDSRDPVSAEFAFEAFSKAGFKPISAICEIIDNSIEANSQNIIIKFDWKQTSTKSSKRTKSFVFIDDGDGMDEKKIYDYFIATESDKRDKKTGIGKFGVGAYMSCISQARRGEVYSKLKGGTWLYTELVVGNKIPKPVPKDPPTAYTKFEHGTIVIWSDSYSKFTEEDITKGNESLKHELGRIYRKFLTDDKLVPDKNGSKIVKNERVVKIKIDNDGQFLDVIAYDPLFVTYNQKKDDEKPKYTSQRVKLSSEDHSGFMIITYSSFPESWWSKGYRPGNQDVNTKERMISERDEGISLVREGREIYFGKYPGGPLIIKGASTTPGNRSYFESTDRWTGIEIEFTKESDDIFGVEFNKTRILMEKYARKMISEAISPTVVSRRKYFSSKRAEAEEKNSRANAKGGRKGTKIIHDKTRKPTYSSEEERKLREFAEKYKDDLESTEDVYADLLNGYHVSLGYGLDPNGPFVSFNYEADSVLVKYNMEHPFMKRFFEILEETGLKLGAESSKVGMIKEIQSVRALLDILIASFGFASTIFPDVAKYQEINQTIQYLVTHWGISANKLSNVDLNLE